MHRGKNNSLLIHKITGSELTITTRIKNLGYDRQFMKSVSLMSYNGQE